MDTKALRQKILDLAIRGKLVPQDPNDEPASVLLERIRAEKQQMVKDGKLKAKDIKNDTVIFKGDDNLHYEQFADGTVKCIEDEIPFELPDGWAWARLGALAHYKKGPFGSSITKAMFVPESKDAIKVYEQKNAINKNDTLGNYFVTKEKYEELKGFEVFPGDIIVSCAGTIGETFVMPNSMRKGIINQALMKISLYNSSMKDFYLIYFDCKLKALANEQGYGMALKNIPPFDILKQYLVSLPPLPEQRRIIDKINIVSNVLTAIDNHIDKLSIDISNVISKILDLAIRGKLVPQDPNDEPASVLLERIRVEKEELIKQGKIKRDKKESVIFKGDDNSYYEKYGEKLPSGWVVTNFETLLEYEQPTKYIVNDTNYKPTYKTPVLTAGKSFLLGYTNETDNIFDDLPVIIFDDFTTESKFVDFPFKVKSSAMKILHINQDFVLPKYAFYLMQATEIDHDNHQRYWISTYSQEIVALPPINEQERILTTLEHYYNLLDVLQ